MTVLKFQYQSIMWGLILLTQYSTFVSSDMAPLTKLSGKDVTSEVFGNSDRRGSVFPAAYGDFNSDKLTDMVTVTSDMTGIVIYLGYEEAPLLRKAINCNIDAKGGSIQIVGISLGDFTGDGLMDVVVSFVHPGKENITRVLVFQGNGTDLICPDTGEVQKTIDMVQEPLILDLDGDMIMDLLGEVWVGDKTERHIWNFKPSFHQPQYEDHKFETAKENEVFRPMVNSSSNAFVDINGDMVPELVLMTREPHAEQSKNYCFIEYYTIHVVNERITFSETRPAVLLDPTHNQTNVYGQPIFMDLNQDGRLFHLIPFCTKRKCKDGDQGILAVYDGNVTKLPVVFKDKMSFYVGDRHSGWGTHYARTITLRAGDYNLDGFPDLIGVVDNPSDKSGRAVIFENVQCLPDSSEKACIHSRTFRINYDVLQQYSQVALATFYDIYEDGLIDIIVVRRTNNRTAHKDKDDKYEVRAFQNSPDYDANFMKVMVLSGRKCLKCPKSEIPYGNIIPGPVISYKTTTQAGDRQVAVAAQFYRSSHMTMDLPCTIFGIGHSPNFVETLHVNIGYSTSNDSHIWPQIIPNSQIIVIPSPLDKPKQWKAKLFLTPSKAVLNTFGVLVGFCLFVTSLVLALQYKERREDRKDKLNEARQFHMM